MQEAAAAGLEQARPRGYFAQHLREYEARREILLGAFQDLGLEYVWPEGSYFALLVSLTASLQAPLRTRGWCRWR